MAIEWILVSLFAINSKSVQTSYINQFTTSTACEAAAQALRQGNSDTAQPRKFECVKYDPMK